MPEKDTDIQQQMAMLRADYTARLPAKAQELERLWKQLCSSWDAGALATLHRLTHTLAGTGGAFGAPAISEAASGLERTLTGLTETARPANETQKALITGQLNELRIVAADAADGSDECEAIDATGPCEQSASTTQRVYAFGDDTRFIDSLAQQIGHFGYEVETFTRLNDLERAVNRAVPAVIIVDALPPHKDTGGLQAIQRIQCERESPLPVIFVAEPISMAHRLEAVRAGGVAHLNKPVDIGAVINKLDLLTGKRQYEPFRILIIDDYAPQAKYHALILEQAGMITAIVNDPMQVMRPLVEFSPDIILMDMYMPECDGVELARLIRQQEAYVSVPIVFLSTEQDTDKQLSAMKEGADDFLTKPIQAGHLVSSVTARAERSRILRSFMERDGLTGLFNHTKVKEQLAVELARAKRQNTALAYAMLDIDDFKSINDNYGHAAGDRVIKSLARLLRQRLRTGDIIGRYGGEEFAVILPGTNVQDAFTVLDQLRENFLGLQHSCGDTVFSVSCSCGIATYPEFSDISLLSDAADQALYRAKREGKDRVVLNDR